MAFANFVIHNHIFYLTFTSCQSLCIVQCIVPHLSNLAASIYPLCLYINSVECHFLLEHCSNFL